jgi:protein SCO1/2
MFRTLIALFVAFAAAGVQADPPPLPAESVYHLAVPLLDQDARESTFAAGRGRVRIVSMFYANCPYVCPMIVETLKRTERELADDARARLSVLLVTLDPERDDPAALAKVAAQRKLDTTRWTLGRTAPEDVRKLAAVLGIQYRQLENREFNHSSALILLDAEGRVLARSSVLGEPDPEFVRAVAAALAAPDR